MSWKKLLADGRIERRKTTQEELEKLRELGEQQLDDAARSKEAGLSADARFGLAYDAARTFATLVMRAEGYRVKSSHGAHRTTFEGLAAVGDKAISQNFDYFDLARQKRNELTYDRVGVVSEQEAEELLQKAQRFSETVEIWLSRNHPSFTRSREAEQEPEKDQGKDLDR